MFWHKKIRNNWILLFFTLIALGIVLATMVILLVFVRKINNQKVNKTTNLPVQNNNYQLILTEVSQRYLTNWQNWQKEWETKTDKEKYLKAFANNLQTMRVPAEKLETHLKVYLTWQKESTKLSNQDLTIIKNQVNTWISELTETK